MLWYFMKVARILGSGTVCYFVFFWSIFLYFLLFLVSCQYQCKWLSVKTLLQSDIHVLCFEQVVKLYSLTHSLSCCSCSFIVVIRGLFTLFVEIYSTFCRCFSSLYSYSSILWHGWVTGRVSSLWKLLLQNPLGWQLNEWPKVQSKILCVQPLSL